MLTPGLNITVMKRMLAVSILVSTLTAAGLALAPAARSGDVEGAISYIRARQTAGGGFAEPGASPDGLTTCWAMLAGSSAGKRVLEWSNGGWTPMAFLESQAESLDSLADIEIYCLAIAEAGADARNLGGKNLPALIKAQAGQDGRIGATVAETCRGLIALRAAGEQPPAKSGEWLMEQQRADGGWGESDEVVVADTALAVQALEGLGIADGTINRAAMKLLRERIAPDGGFADETGSSNTELTAQVACAIYAAGGDPSSPDWTFHGNNPAGFLDSMQAGDGHYRYSRNAESQPALTTCMAVPPSVGKHFPLGSAGARDESPGALRDLGTTGAGLVPGTGPAVSTRQGESSPTELRASGNGSAHGGSGGVWLFLAMCVIYLLTLALAALAAALLYVPREEGGVHARAAGGAMGGGPGPGRPD